MRQGFRHSQELFTGTQTELGGGGREAGKEQTVSFSIATSYSSSLVQLYSLSQSRSQETQVGTSSTNLQVLLASAHVPSGGGVVVKLTSIGQPGWGPR